MAKAAKSISAAQLTNLTRAAVKAVKVPGRFVGTGPVMGFIADPARSAEEHLALATSVTSQLSAQGRASGIAGLKAKPVVVRRPGTIIAGFIAPELSLQVR